MKAEPEDLVELESFYKYKSGGLMIHALDLEPACLIVMISVKNIKGLVFRGKGTSSH